jgi:DNA-binding CsgD family transcriptional regulator
MGIESPREPAPSLAWDAASVSLAGGMPPENSIDVAPLFAVAEILVGHTCGVAERLCAEVARITDQRATLHVHPRQPVLRSGTRLAEGARQLPVEFNGWGYGSLLVDPDPSDPAAPALPDAVSRGLACTCGAILYLLDQAALVEVLSQHLPTQLPEHLTPRQREILLLMLQGLSDDEIVAALHITPETLKKHRHQLYGRLGVHRAQDVLLAAHQARLVSYLALE